MNIEEISSTALDKLVLTHPYAKDFFLSLGINVIDGRLTAQQFIDSLSETFLEDCGLDRTQMLGHFTEFVREMNYMRDLSRQQVASLTIIGGRDKGGMHENTILTLRPGDIVSVVGPTGSGKSRLLADIECLAQKDTPTGRQILINGCAPDACRRFSVEHKIVSQLSQNMNFVAELTVGEFITLHAESRMVPDPAEAVNRIISCANTLAGEPVHTSVPITQLSGGQSRALMIADTALLSPLPVVVIDEVENAGIDRGKALDLLVKGKKIVLLSTHDPILALMGDMRIVIRNGGIADIIHTSRQEKINLSALQKIDAGMAELRNLIRTGGTVDLDLSRHFSSPGQA